MVLFGGGGRFLLRDFFNGMRIVLNNTFEQKVIFDLRSDLYAHIQQLPLTWFDNRATGDIMTRAAGGRDGGGAGADRRHRAGRRSRCCRSRSSAAVLFHYSPKLALAGAAADPAARAGALAYTLTAHARYRLQRKASSAMNSLLHDNLAGIRQIKTLRARARGARALQRREQRAARGDADRDARVGDLFSPSMSFFGACGACSLSVSAGARCSTAQMQSRRPGGVSLAGAVVSTSRSANCISSTSSSRRGARRASACSRSSTTTAGARRRSKGCRTNAEG